MQVNISGHQLEVTKPLREYVELKLKKLEGTLTRLQTCSHDGGRKLKQKIEATLHIHGGEVVANAEHDDMYAAIDLLTDKLNRQLLKHKEKQQSILKGAAAR